MNKWLAILVTLSTLSSCANMPISTVMSRCDVGNNLDNFSFWKACVKETYTQEGNHPNRPDIKLYYLQLDQIDEQYRLNRISNSKAKELAYIAWKETVDSTNQRSATSNGAANAALIGLGIGMMNGTGNQHQQPAYENSQACIYNQWGNKGLCYPSMQACILANRNMQSGECH